MDYIGTGLSAIKGISKVRSLLSSKKRKTYGKTHYGKATVIQNKGYTPNYNTRQLAQLLKDSGTAEKKFLDQTITSTLCNSSTAHAFQLLNAPVQGVDENSRIGRAIRVHSLTINASISVDQTGGTGQGWVELLLLQDMQPNGAAPGATNVWITDELFSLRNLDQRKRFKIWKHWRVYVANPNNGAGAYNTCHAEGIIDDYIKFKQPIQTEYNGTNGGTIADITKNSLYLVGVFSDNYPGFQTNLPVVKGKVRIRFTDT